MTSARAATEEEKRITEERILSAMREGARRFPDIVKSVATVRYVNGTSRRAMVKRTLQDMKARGLVKAAHSGWDLVEEVKRDTKPSNFGLTPAMISGSWGY